MKNKLLLGLSLLLITMAFTYQTTSNHPFFDELKTKLKAYSSHYEHEKVYLQLDKTFVEPNETLWFSAYIRDAATLKRTKKSAIVYVELLNPKGDVVSKKELICAKGKAKGEFLIRQSWVGGLYKIRAFTKWQKNHKAIFERTIQVQKAILPRLNMEVQFERKAYGAGDDVEARLDLNTLENKPLGNHNFKYQVFVKGELMNTFNSITNEDGRAILKFSLPDTLNSADGLLNVMINYKGSTEAISRSIPITLNHIDLQFMPEGGDMITGLSNKVAFKAINEFGKPADVEGIIYNQNEEEITRFRSYHDGMGAFDLKPQKNEIYTAKITKPITRTYVLPNALANGFLMTIDEVEKKQVKLMLQSTLLKQEVFLVGQSHGKIHFKKTLILSKKKTEIIIPTQNFPIGIAQFTLFDEQQQPHTERLVFLNPHQQLDITIKTDKKKYLPREKVKMAIEVKNEKGEPVQGDFSLAVVDDKLLTFADDKQGHILSSLLLESDLKGKVHEPNFYFDETEEKATKALDYLMMTQGWRRYNWKSVLAEAFEPMTFKADKALFGGKVVDGYQNPVENAVVSVLHTDYVTITDALGRFEFEGLDFSEKGALLQIEKEGMKFTKHFVRQYDTDLIITMPSVPAAVFGEVLLDSMQIQLNNDITVCLVSNDGVQYCQRTDNDGLYQFHIVDAGHYELVIKRWGYRTKRLKNIILYANQIVQIDANLKQGNDWKQGEQVIEFQNQLPPQKTTQTSLNLDAYQFESSLSTTSQEVTVVAYRMPLIAQDNTSQGKTVTREEIQNLPVRDLSGIMAITAGVSQVDVGQPISFRGSRTNTNDIYIDGQRIRGSFVAQSEIDQVQILTGGIPAMYGGWTASVPPSTYQDPKRRSIETPYPHENPVKVADLSGGITFSSVSSWEYYGTPSSSSYYPYWKNYSNRSAIYYADSKCEGDSLQKLNCAKNQLYDYLYDEAIASIKTEDLRGLISMNIKSTGEIEGVYRGYEEEHNPNYHLIGQILKKTDWKPFKKIKKTKKTKRFNYHIAANLLVKDNGENPKTGYSTGVTYYHPNYESYQYRNNLDKRKTIYWDASVRTDKDGKATVEFYVSDEITQFRATLEGLGYQGEIGRSEFKFYSQKEFSLDAKIPSQVLAGDVMKIALVLTNNTSKPITGKLSNFAFDNFERIDSIAEEQTIAPNTTKTMQLIYKAKRNYATYHRNTFFAIKFKGKGITEQIKTYIKVHQIGYPVRENFVGDSQKNSMNFDLEELIENTLDVSFKIYPNILEETMNTLDKMIKRPYGCFEQVSSANYPNILALKYLKDTKQTNLKVGLKAAAFLEYGYQKLAGYEIKGGGFDWYGKPSAHVGLTAYGLVQFEDMKAVYPVSQKLIDRTANWLLAQRDGKGSWNRKRAYSFGNFDSNIGDAYIVWAMTEAGYGDSIKTEIQKSYKVAMKTKDPYIMGFMANVLLKRKDKRSQELMTILLELQSKDGSWAGTKRTITSNWGTSKNVKTTALVALAMMKEGKRTKALDDAIRFILLSKSMYGYGNTQATVMALKALLAYDKMKTKATKLEGDFSIIVNNEKVKTYDLDAYESGIIQFDSLGQYLNTGQNNIEVVFENPNQELPFQIDFAYRRLRSSNAKNASIHLTTTLNNTNSKVGEIVRLQAKLQNTTADTIASPMAILSIPAGLSLQPWQLKELQEKEVFDYYEIKEEQLVVYYRMLLPKGEKILNLDLKAEISGTYAALPSSVFPYYSDEKAFWSEVGKVVIE